MRTKEPAFPILGDPYLKAIPWAMIEPHEEQAQRNHSQSLNRLADRGGLGCSEAYAVMTNNRWKRIDEDWCRLWLCSEIWKRRQAEEAARTTKDTTNDD